MNPALRLPPDFQALEVFVDDWALDSTDARRDRRCGSSMVEIQRFYDAIVARAEDGIAYLEQYPLGDMPPDAECLFKLLLAMNHAAIAVEMHGQPRAHAAKYPNSVRMTQGPWPLGGSFRLGEMS